ncbi:MAG: hypothetical protein ACRDZ7_17880 [Acidimicrobiia bacterium]
MSRRARVIPVRWLPLGVAGMTLRHVILVRRGWEGDEALLAHEMVHVRQWEELGVPRFVWRYLSSYFRGRLGGLSHHDAYQAIPLEVEARRIAGR